MNTISHQQLNKNLKVGNVYRREHLTRFSKAVDRDLHTLVSKGLLDKVAPGLYYKPKHSKYGALPPPEDEMVQAFLKEDQYLLFSWNDFNSLGLGLTQLYNSTVVYNFKRHCKCKLGNKQFDFRRPPRGFPQQLSREYLLVELVNNLRLLAEDSDSVKAAIKTHFNKFNKKVTLTLAKQYGKVSTRRFFEKLENE